MLGELRSLLPTERECAWTPRFRGLPLRRCAGSEALLHSLALEDGGAVDFWTEAALFGQSGLPTIVLGPGSIRQAHTAGEWVSLAQLLQSTALYTRLLATSA